MDEPHPGPTELTGLAGKVVKEEKVLIPESSAVCQLETKLSKKYFETCQC